LLKNYLFTANVLFSDECEVVGDVSAVKYCARAWLLCSWCRTERLHGRRNCGHQSQSGL